MPEANPQSSLTEDELSIFLRKAKTLSEALPYIQMFRGETVVVKYGGNAMQDEALKQNIVEDLVMLELIGMHPVVVHGGGPEITNLMQRRGLESKFVDGMRVTDAPTLEAVETALAEVRGDLVARIERQDGRAVALSGKDGGLFQCKKLLLAGKDGQEIDLGFVGEITQVDPRLIRDMGGQQSIPVISPLAVDAQGQTHNVNADLAAAELARALGARKFILLTNVRGVLRDPSDSSTLIHSIRMDEIEGLITDGVISGGMIPKTQACLRALDHGVRKAHILDGRLPHALLLELLTPKGVGTQIIH